MDISCLFTLAYLWFVAVVGRSIQRLCIQDKVMDVFHWFADLSQTLFPIAVLVFSNQMSFFIMSDCRFVFIVDKLTRAAGVALRCTRGPLYTNSHGCFPTPTQYTTNVKVNYFNWYKRESSFNLDWWLCPLTLPTSDNGHHTLPCPL